MQGNVGLGSSRREPMRIPEPTATWKEQSKRIATNTDQSRRYLLGIQLDNGKEITVVFQGSPLSFKEAVKAYREINSNDRKRLSVYRIEKLELS